MKKEYYYGIASGSSGNCGLYVCGDTAVLLDLGVSMRRLRQALAPLGLDLPDIRAVLLTHEHTDHVRGLATLCKKYELPVYATAGTVQALTERMPQIGKSLRPISGGMPFSLEDVTVTPFLTPHDAAESSGYVLKSAQASFGYCTDLGFVPQAVQQRLTGCDAVVLESNHDPYMLQAGPYPAYLKQRIRSAQGHLSNPDCALCAATLAGKGTGTFILSHLSEQNNTPLLAFRETRQALDAVGADSALYIAPKGTMQRPVPVRRTEAVRCCR